MQRVLPTTYVPSLILLVAELSKNDVHFFSSFVLKVASFMFDPFFIGNVDAGQVKVVKVLEGTGPQSLKVIMRLNDNFHALVLKPTLGDRDQIVIDRLKHIFNLRPMNVFGLSLNFVYVNGRRLEGHNSEYLAFASNLEFVLGDFDHPHVSNFEGLSFDRKVDLLMVLFFRFLVGTRGGLSRNEDILDFGNYYVSTNEQKFSSADVNHEFACQFSSFEDACWIEAIQKFTKGVLKDAIRGVVYQHDDYLRNTKGKSAKGRLSIPPKRVMQILEERLEILKTQDVESLKLQLRVKLE